jgi:hypothetical protein
MFAECMQPEEISDFISGVGIALLTILVMVDDQVKEATIKHNSKLVRHHKQKVDQCLDDVLRILQEAILLTKQPHRSLQLLTLMQRAQMRNVYH